MKGVAVLAICVLLSAVGCASGESYVSPAFHFFSVQKVAVTDVDGSPPGFGVYGAIGDYFIMELTKRGYTVVDRGQADALVEVGVPEFGQRVTVTAKMTRADEGTLLWIASGTASTGRVLATATGIAVGAAAGSTIGHGSGRVLAGTAGAALGGIAGYNLSPSEMKATRKAVARACKSLPHQSDR